MEEQTKRISIQPLVRFVKSHEVAWQMWDSNINFFREEGYEYIDEEDRIESELRNKKALDILIKSKECVVFVPDVDDNTCFEDLIEWSEGQDLLVLVDNELLLCIAPCDKDEVLAMTA